MARLQFKHTLPEEPLRVSPVRLTPGQLFVWDGDPDGIPDESPKMRLHEDQYVTLRDGVVCFLTDAAADEVIVCKGHLTWTEERRPAKE